MSRPNRRDDDAPFEYLQARVDPATKAAIFDAAKRSRVSVALYLDLLMQQLVDDDGQLPRVTIPLRTEGTLPIDMAA